jgi:hypothetical protein
MIEFKSWGKIVRGNAEQVVVTEKMDGTNACIIIEGGVVAAQSRNKIITPDSDNYGFARWVEVNKEALKTLGEGYHFGEWCGNGIQSNPHNFPEKRFYLFNTRRWGTNTDLPVICDVVPILYEGTKDELVIQDVLDNLWEEAKGKYIPEGVIVYHRFTGIMYKYTFKMTEGKWKGE